MKINRHGTGVQFKFANGWTVSIVEHATSGLDVMVWNPGERNVAFTFGDSAYAQEELLRIPEDAIADVLSTVRKFTASTTLFHASLSLAGALVGACSFIRPAGPLVEESAEQSHHCVSKYDTVADLSTGNLYPVSDFKEMVESRTLIDYDGYGNPVKDGWIDKSTQVHPSLIDEKLPADATHVLWYNR